MKKIKIAAGITLYNPQAKTIDHINEYLNSFDMVLVFDNSDKRGNEHNKLIDKFTNDRRLIYIDGKGNCGLPFAYNRMMSEEKIADFDYMCTLDQDSIFSHEDITIIRKYIEERYIAIRNNVAVIAPYIDYGRKIDREHKREKRIEDRGRVITSGAFVNLYLYHSGNFSYDENYFIDKFEIDLCKQFTNAGYKILMYHASILHQRLGEESGHDHPNHSPLRHYYLFRNRFYYNKKFYKFPVRVCLNIMQTLKHLALIVMYENNKTKKVFQLKNAIFDYKCKCYGKTNKV